MTIMTHKPKLSHRDGRSAVYQGKVAPKGSLWRDVVAGTVFIAVLLLGVAAVLVGGLLVFG